MVEEPNIAIVGATGLVGREMIALLEERDFCCGEIRLFASARSAGRVVKCCGREVEIRALEEAGAEGFAGIDIALFSAGGDVSREYGPIAVEAGATVIDNSSAFRMDARFPLVVPEINGDAIRRGTILANPNCSTIIMLMAVTPIRRMFGLRRMSVCTYQAASGGGARAMEELLAQTRMVLEGGEEPVEVVAGISPMRAFNVFCHDSEVGDDGYNVEERKMIEEARKIWGDDQVAITATCVRVPVVRTHCEAINLTFDREITEDDLEGIRVAVDSFEGVRVLDDRVGNRFPTPREASKRDEVLVGRLRLDVSQMNKAGTASRGVELFVAGDQIRKGAALNAVQIAERLVGVD